MLEKVSIEHITIGMYIEQIQANNTRTKMKKPGFIRRSETIENLRQKGVEFVWINSEAVDEELTVEQHQGPQTNASAEMAKSVSRTINVKDISIAEELLDISKKRIQKLLDDIYSNQPIDIEPISELGSDIVDNIFTRPEAVHWVSAIRNKSDYLMEHSLNVSIHLVNFGRYLGLDQQTLQDLAIGGIVHDVGKILVKDEVLNKPGKLTPEEFDHMKLHQVYSQPVLDSIEGLPETSRMVSLMHHEKLDGTGYPNGLQGDDLPLIGRMSCIVDIYDALTAERCYKAAMSPSEAFKIMMSLTPFHLDRDLLKKFIMCVGFYPIGSLVELSNGRIGFVWESDSSDLTTPVVKTFFSAREQAYRNIEYVCLKKRPDIKIIRAVSESKIGVDFSRFRSITA